MKSSSFLLLVGSTLFGLTSPLSAQTWNQTAAGNYDWNLNGNWTAPFPNATGASANINNNIAGNQTIRLQQAITIGILNIGDSDDSHGFTISEGTGSNRLTFQSGSPGGATQLNAGGTKTANFLAGITLGGTSPLTVSASSSGSVTLGGLLTTNGNSLFFVGGAATTNQFNLNGDVVGSGTITNNSLAAVAVSGTKSYTGTLVANRGTGSDSNSGSFTLTNGSMTSASEFVINGRLTAGASQGGGSIASGNNSGKSENPGQRLTSNRITLNGGSLLDNGQNFSGTAIGSLVQDNVANFDFNSSYSLVYMGVSGNSSGTYLTVTTLERANGATGFVRSSKLGDTARFTAGNVASFLKGAGGAEGSTTMSILPWLGAHNTNGSASTADGFATSGSNGIRALTGSEYDSTALTSGSNAVNASVGSVVLTGNQTLNSLRYTSSSATNIGSGNTLAVTSGGVFFSNNNGGIGAAGAAAAGTLNFGGAEGVVWANGTLTNSIGAVIAGSGGLTKAGTGTLTLTGANTYSGATYVSAGTMVVGDGVNASNLGTSGNVGVAGGATLSLLNNNTISDTAILSLENIGFFNGMMSLATGVNETVGALYLGDVFQIAGTYGSTSSSATFQNDSYFSGAGILTVAAIPEPSSLALLALGVFALASRRRRVR